MRISICEHVKMGGGRCGSPAMRGLRYCYYHRGAHSELPPAELLAGLGCHGHEDELRIRHEPYPGALHPRFFQLAHALMHNEIDLRRGKLMLKSLHRAAGRVFR